MDFLKANLAVFSNAKNYRRDPLVPLVVPTVNLPHLSLIPHQRKHHGLEKGFLVCNSNCAVIGLVIPFAAMAARFGPIETVSVVTMQAVSGAGYPGVSSMDVIDNVVPYISGEEDKLETEAQKILGGISADATAFEELTSLKVSASCNRVPVLDGHTACVSLRFARRPAPSAEEVREALREYVSDVEKLGCPSAPKPSIMVFGDDQPDRPQPRLDRELSRGYTVSVGRVREDESGIFDLKFVALSHNSKSYMLLSCLCALTLPLYFLFLLLFAISEDGKADNTSPHNSGHRGRRLVDIERRGGCAEGLCLDSKSDAGGFPLGSKCMVIRITWLHIRDNRRKSYLFSLLGYTQDIDSEYGSTSFGGGVHEN